jgi:acetyltransferase-like isoleucine patch superfamily enzyme
MINIIIRKLKKSDTYSIDPDLTFIDMFYILKQRMFQLIRGFFIKPFLKKSNGFIFKGKNVKMLHLNKLTCGKNLIIEDNVYINALSKTGINLGTNVTIQRDCILICTGVIRNLGKGISIANNVGLNARVYLGGQGGIEIGENVIIGPDVKIFSENHNYKMANIFIKDQGENRKGVKIGNDCWIGSGSIILDGVNLSSGCVVAAGSVVTKSFQAFSVIGGTPAKIIKTRE